MSFDLEPGTVAAIVGVNGAGKSTLLALLAKFFTPTSGRISVYGRDIASLEAEDIRAQMTVAYQDFVKFEYQMLKSVGIGRPADGSTAETPFPRADVARAVDLAGLTERAGHLPNGLDTQLGSTWPDGVDLSGGEWQKVALARAHMRPNARILILDEPSSALDAEAERDLFERIIATAHRAQKAGGITLIVTHRLSSARSADVLLVLDGGELVQSGSHAQLIRIPGVYRDLYRAQARAFT